MMRNLNMGLPGWTVTLLMLVVALNWDSHRALVVGRRASTLSKEEGSDAPKSCHLRELELCTVGALSIFQNPNGLPDSQVELTRQCEYLNESVSCADDYSKNCLTDSQSRLASMIAGPALKLASDFCQPESELRRNYTQHVECFREVQRDHQRPCMSDFQTAFEGIHKINDSQRLPLICCNINRLKECLFVPIDNECGTNASTTIEGLLEALFGGAHYLPCRNYNYTNQVCLDLLPKIGSKPHSGRNTSALSRIVSGFTNVPAQL